MRNELKALDEANEKVEEECHFVRKHNSRLKGDFQLYGRDTLGFEVPSNASNECKLYSTSEMKLLDLMRERQGERAMEKMEKEGKVGELEMFKRRKEVQNEVIRKTGAITRAFVWKEKL